MAQGLEDSRGEAEDAEGGKGLRAWCYAGALGSSRRGGRATMLLLGCLVASVPVAVDHLLSEYGEAAATGGAAHGS